ncbi:MAG TPA: type II toxin-antitoxin system Phd/YefM family antitoxin [Bryobacteraceae bacterium]|jgi:prevent-host-death family protein
MVTNIREAKTHLSRLVERAAAGEEIVIAKAGKPMAKLVPYPKIPPKRKLGGWKGKVWIGPNFDELPPEILAAFNEGKDL